MTPENIQSLINEALALEIEEAKEAGKLGYMARVFVQATMPHSKQSGCVFTRQNGNFKLKIMADDEAGLPYGAMPRLLLSYLNTEAVKTKESKITLGRSMSEFMRKIGFDMPRGGRRGNITTLKNQAHRLFSSVISCTYEQEELLGGKRLLLADEHMLWWDTKNIEQQNIFESYVQLSQPFFEEITKNPIPIDLRVIQLLKGSSMDLDIYCWLTYRMSYLKRPTKIPWEALQLQFGAGYPDTPQGKADFKRKFIQSLTKVATVYRAVNVSPSKDYLTLNPSRPHLWKKAV